MDDRVLCSWLETHARNAPRRVALKAGSHAVTFSELNDRVLRAAGALHALGLRQGDVVSIQLPNTSEFVVSFLAVTACGAIAQTLHMPYRHMEQVAILRHSGAKMAICLTGEDDSGRASDARALINADTALETVIAVGDPVAGTVPFAELLAAEPLRDRPDIGPDDPFLLLYTSGTTASPKGVPHNYSGFLANARRSAAEFAITPDDVLLSAAPFTHLYGLFVLHLSLASGCANALLPAFDPGKFLACLQDARPTAVFAAPAHFAPFVAAGALTADHIRSVRLLCLSGAPVPPALAETIDGLLESGEVIQLWGMSELQAGSYGRPGDPATSRFTTAGRAAPHTQLRVVDGAQAVLAVGTEGELEVKGPAVFAGYLNNEAETALAFTDDGWFRTGDLAILDGGGYVTLTGRVKDIINRGGIKYNPIDIELQILALDGIAACAIVPYPDPILGERACVCVTLEPDASLTLKDVTEHLDRVGIAKHKWPERLEVIDPMPMTPTRKIMRGELKKRIS